MPNRVTFLVDGFNLYHSVDTAIQKSGKGLKWLDISSLMRSFLYTYGKDAPIGVDDDRILARIRDISPSSASRRST